MNAISAVQAKGIHANVVMNADKVNMARLPELRTALEPMGVMVTPGKLNDYAHTFDCPGSRFAKPNFDLYTHQEFAQAGFEDLSRRFEPGSKQLRRALKGMLSPCDHFCSGQLEQSYIVDCAGDVYKCDGWMGDPSRALFNLLDGSAPVTDNVCWDPFDAQQVRESGAVAASGRACAACHLLPLCWGNCSWERECCGWPCHPLMTTMGQYLTLYRGCFESTDEDFQLLAPAR